MTLDMLKTSPVEVAPAALETAAPIGNETESRFDRLMDEQFSSEKTSSKKELRKKKPDPSEQPKERAEDPVETVPPVVEAVVEKVAPEKKTEGVSALEVKDPPADEVHAPSGKKAEPAVTAPVNSLQKNPAQQTETSHEKTPKEGAKLNDTAVKSSTEAEKSMEQALEGALKEGSFSLDEKSGGAEEGKLSAKKPTETKKVPGAETAPVSGPSKSIEPNTSEVEAQGINRAGKEPSSVENALKEFLKPMESAEFHSSPAESMIDGKKIEEIVSNAASELRTKENPTEVGETKSRNGASVEVQTAPAETTDGGSHFDGQEGNSGNGNSGELILDLGSETADTSRSSKNNDTTSFARLLGRQLSDGGNRQIAEKIGITMKGQNTGEIKLILKPESLGKVKILLDMNENHIAGRIIVENSNVREVFEQNMDALNKALKENGFQTEGLEVSVDDHSGEQRREQAESDRSSAYYIKSARELERQTDVKKAYGNSSHVDMVV